MKPLDTADTGVIGSDVQHLAAAQHTVDPTNQLSGTQFGPGAIQDVPLGQVPDDIEPVESPELLLSRRIEDSESSGAMPGGVPGLGGLGGGAGEADPQSILSGLPDDVSGLLGGAESGIAHAVSQTQGVLDQVNGAVGAAVSSGAAQAAQLTQQVSAALPQLPADPVAALMSGLSLPALPGVDQLIAPILELLSSFGTGVLGALDPTQILSQSSQIVETAMQIGKGSMSAVQQVWEGQASESAQVAEQKANVQGQEASQRGFDISGLTQLAASVVQQGNTQLVGIASTFAAQATALAPVILTPPGQAALISSATQHLGNAVTVVNATRGDLAGKTAELNGIVGQLLGQSGLPAPEEIARAAAENIGEPLIGQAQEAATQASGLGSNAGTGTGTSPSLGTQTASQSSTTPGTGMSGLGALGTARPGSSLGSGSSGLGIGTSTSPIAGSPGSVVTPPVAAVPTGSLGTTPATASTTPASAGNSFMGGPAAGAAGQRGDGEEHGRTVQSYQSLVGNDDLTGPLGESTPDVIGAPHPDELFSDYDQDQF